MQLLTLKVFAGAGSLLVTGACAGVVALDTKPAAAPLRPPINASVAIAGDTGAAANPDHGAALRLPPTPTCQGGLTRAAGVVPAAVQQALEQVLTATTRQARAAVYAQLPADVRTQVAAVLAARSRGAAAGGMRGCTPGSTGSSSAIANLSPGVVDMPANGPVVTDTYVS